MAMSQTRRSMRRFPPAKASRALIAANNLPTGQVKTVCLSACAFLQPPLRCQELRETAMRGLGLILVLALTTTSADEVLAADKSLMSPQISARHHRAHVRHTFWKSK